MITNYERLRYDIYHDEKKVGSYDDRETAIEVCKFEAANRVELLKTKVYYPMMYEEFNVTSYKEVPAEVRYAFWDREREKYLKEHYKIKVVDVTKEEGFQEKLDRFNAILEKYEKTKHKRKKKIRL